MRAPGDVSGLHALECAMDELAVELGIDPVELRLRNHADADPAEDLPWSSKSLNECLRAGAERFGWDRRSPEPRSMQRRRPAGRLGHGAATYPARRAPASASARILPDGSAIVRSASSDMGPGTYTSMTQVAADALGLPSTQVRFELGDTSLPEGARAWRLDDHGEPRAGGARGVPRGAAPGARPRPRRRQLAAARRRR